MRYLIVDDSATVRRTTASLLKAARPGKLDLVEAESSKQAIAAVTGAPFDCIFLDMVLGDDKANGGAAILERILVYDPKARIVLVTGLPRTDPQVQRAIRSGAFAYLQKPLNLANLRQTLDLLDRTKGRRR